MNGVREINELYLLLGILRNERSRTRRELAEFLGVEDYERLHQVTSDCIKLSGHEEAAKLS